MRREIKWNFAENDVPIAEQYEKKDRIDMKNTAELGTKVWKIKNALSGLGISPSSWSTED